jgi:hypothetical protein
VWQSRGEGDDGREGGLGGGKLAEVSTDFYEFA